jgi:hypothetical protein
MPGRQTAPEQRAKQQLKALSATTRTTIKQLAKDPDDRKAAAILDRYEERIEKIVSPRKKPLPPPPPSEFCWTCEKWHPKPRPEEWHLPGAAHWPFAVGVTGVFLLVAFFCEWWAFAVFPVAWLVSFSFVWSILIPAALLVGVIMVLVVTGM